MNDKLLNLIVREVFNGVTAEEVLSVETKTVAGVQYPYALKIGDTLLPSQDIIRLQTEAEMLKNFYLWELLLKRTQYIAQLKACEKATSPDDLHFGKAMIYAVQTIKEVIENILKFKVEQIPNTQDNGNGKSSQKKIVGKSKS